ncbi:MAG: 30S ribosome-binding factor RbfA [Clostridia bacterium]|nr:30S ribosome-binding factor RbfA [Clostridia bacterium]
MSYNRTDRISEEMRRVLSDIIRELKDPRIPTVISVVALSVTKDLRHAKAHVSVMGDEAAKKAAIDALKSAGGFIRREIGARMLLRAVPEFSFVLDNSIEHGAYINELIHKSMEGEL